MATIEHSTTYDHLAAARALAPRIRAAREEIEQGRQIPRWLMQELIDARIFRMWVPRAYGGDEIDIVAFVGVNEELARNDGAVAWAAMNLAVWSGVVAYLPADEARAILASADTVVGGTGNVKPGSKAVQVEGGYQLTGRWGFGSGIHHTNFMFVACPIWDGETPRCTPEEAPVRRFLLIPTGALALQDNWYVGGMRGTGSCDFTVTDLFVPEERSAPAPFSPNAVSPLYRIPQLSFFALSTCGTAFGLARAAIDALVELAQAKTPAGQTSLLRERAAVQADVARAEALLRAGRAFVGEVSRELWEAALRGDEFTPEQQAIGRLAATHAVQSATQAVDLMYNAAGATAIYESSPLERCFRDIHAIAQIGLIAAPSLETVGQALLARSA